MTESSSGIWWYLPRHQLPTAKRLVCAAVAAGVVGLGILWSASAQAHDAVTDALELPFVSLVAGSTLGPIVAAPSSAAF